ncbi:hypothetical protein CPB83DRAFT_896367 [Crepidotus variabilis]|uniref:Uncharacterized protein n=1 Tax=Crepidotus variabilis TaxID=179855 RepID=A0A9P6EBA3_9AGAR|nr:hypothetical protein CPB83DRAFT_896367 [Crepidotus variabilis]
MEHLFRTTGQTTETLLREPAAAFNYYSSCNSSMATSTNQVVDFPLPPTVDIPTSKKALEDAEVALTAAQLALDAMITGRGGRNKSKKLKEAAMKLQAAQAYKNLMMAQYRSLAALDSTESGDIPEATSNAPAKRKATSESFENDIEVSKKPKSNTSSAQTLEVQSLINRANAKTLPDSPISSLPDSSMSVEKDQEINNDQTQEAVQHKASRDGDPDNFEGHTSAPDEGQKTNLKDDHTVEGHLNEGSNHGEGVKVLDLDNLIKLPEDERNRSPSPNTDVEGEVQSNPTRAEHRKEKKQIKISISGGISSSKLDSKACDSTSAIVEFFSDSKDVDPHLRGIMRADPTFVSAAATNSRDLALLVLETTEGNRFCLYHHFKDKANHVRDGWGKPGATIQGIPGKRRVSNKKKKTKNSAVEGYMNCGCREDDALLDFYLSKTLTIQGTVKGKRIENKMTSGDYFNSRQRSFMIALFKKWVGIQVDDLYQRDMDESTYEKYLAVLRAEIAVRELNRVCKDVEYLLIKKAVVA